MIRFYMNYRDEKILEWVLTHKQLKLKYQDVAKDYNCSTRTVQRIFKTFKDSGYIEIENYKRGGILIVVKDDSCH